MKKISLFLIVLALALTACQQATPLPTSTTDPSLIITAAAQTAAVRLTEIALSTPSPTATLAEPTPDLALTAAVETLAAQLTATGAAATPTQALTPSPTVNASAVERLTFLADVTIPDKTVIAAGATFVKTWRVRNDGTTTWTTAYQLAFVQGEKMNAPDRTPLASAVAPGATVDLSVTLVAPTAPGTYVGWFRLLTPSGQLLNDAFYVEIVVPGATGTPGTATATVTPGGATATPTPSVTPGGATATPTPTATTASLTVSNVSASVDNANYTGTCPRQLVFTGSFNASQAGTVTLKWEAASSTPGFTFNLPAEQTVGVVAGANAVSLTMDISNSVVGWLKLHITAPQDVLSSQVDFSVTCQP